MDEPDLTVLSDSQLFEECVAAIDAAAVGESRGGDERSYERAMALMAESHRRGVLAGHVKYCADDTYGRAFEFATAVHAGRAPVTPMCNCVNLRKLGHS